MWQTLEIAGRKAEVLEPRGPVTYAAGVVFLHDVDGLSIRDREAVGAAFAGLDLPVICPRCDGGWWLDWNCPAFDPRITPLAYVRETVVGAIGKRWGAVSPRIGLTGIGMGGQGAIQLAYRHARQFPVVAAISPAIDFHTWHDRDPVLSDVFSSREAARQQTATLHLHPLNWPGHQWLMCDPLDADCFEGCERLASKLDSSGIPFDRDFQTTCGGDRRAYVERQLPRAAHFLAEHLRPA